MLAQAGRDGYGKPKLDAASISFPNLSTLPFLQEVGLPTCVAASNKLVGVGTLRLADFVLLCIALPMPPPPRKTCRGAVVLLDNKLQDVPAKDNKPQAATLALPPWQSWQILAALPDLAYMSSFLWEPVRF